MEVIAIRKGCYSESKINFEIANFVFLTTLNLMQFKNVLKFLNVFFFTKAKRIKKKNL